ncbi:hypothetical protein GCM10011504_45540 [Siccirubricoccus deserti]|nr:hypothetical protein GCM10011504_45540 [Siccirubricoccus deserti]
MEGFAVGVRQNIQPHRTVDPGRGVVHESNAPGRIGDDHSLGDLPKDGGVCGYLAPNLAPKILPLRRWHALALVQGRAGLESIGSPI